jgi:hypothetical protein
MPELLRGEGLGRANVVGRKVRMVLDNLLAAHAGTELPQGSSTVIRVPLIVGLPVMIRGSTTIRSCQRALWIIFVPSSRPNRCRAEPSQPQHRDRFVEGRYRVLPQGGYPRSDLLAESCAQ